MNAEEVERIQQNKDRNEQKSLVRTTETTVFSGPLPPPAAIEHYERILPGAAERIFRMAEEQSKHRKELESQVVASDIRRSRLGLLFGFIIGLSALAASVAMVYLGQAVGGSVLGIGTIGGLVGVFVYGSQLRIKEREQRRERR